MKHEPREPRFPRFPQQPLDYAHDFDLDDYTRGIGFTDLLYGTIFAIIGLCVFLLFFVVGE